MPVDFDRALGETEDFIRRQIGSRAAREAQKRKVQRGIREVLRRMRRAALTFVGLLIALIGYSALVAPVGLLTWIVAIPTFFLAAMIVLFWPSRRPAPRPAPGEPAQLDALAARTEDWLLGRCGELPRAALPAVDGIALRLNEMQADLQRVPMGTPLAGEAQRLIGQHLPQLVESYLSLPQSQRSGASENSRRLTECLETVGEELDRLSGEIARDRTHGFETHRRFIETRYRDRA